MIIKKDKTSLFAGDINKSENISQNDWQAQK